ncbi:MULTISPECIES: DsbA family protein [Streptomyces]|uniref:DsbA family protein n=1 Tax=Streptomyces TaxID=1883 RepID=UPI0006AF6B23|nr:MULTISPECIES: thioredoxin domain-containing protein [unclassified Streptomyces]KOU27250.1 DSBA oxidoreductase [Streptomyces sp. WM6349]KOU99255.1 DSBA oxidoreductase [Streptomyces sp. XY511]KOV08906.1 DSBA oxidoreductase [Streptomyces sp. XY533]KOV55420.1 DSBA oxidoreductase [Streptomyces sp. H036]MCI4082410.1 DsbA family protein [Streptomyces sp. MMS21 TC-5]
MSSSSSKNGRKTTSAAKPLLISAGVALAAVTLGIVSWQATAPAEQGSAGSSPAAAPRDDTSAALRALARREAGDKLALGRADAPVVLIEYSDFKCGYCGKFARDTEPELVKKYVDNGTLRIEWRNFPIFGAESEAAARAAWAAGQQDRFAAFHSAAYADGSKEKGFAEPRLLELAREAGVPDLDRFKADMAGEQAAAALKKDQEEGYRIGVTSTPSFLVNGRPIAGAQPLAAFTAAIAQAEAAAKP